MDYVDNIKKLIDYLPNLIIYIVPGYITIRIIQFIIQRKQLRDNVEVFNYIVCSYIIKGSTEFAFNKYINQTNYIFVIIIVSIISGIVIGVFIKSDMFNKLLKKLKINLTIHANILDDIDDRKYGVIMRVHLLDNENIYEGLLRKYENAHNPDDIHIMLSEYTRYKNQDNDTVQVEDYSDDPTAWIVLRKKDIKIIEVFYDKRSEVIKKEVLQTNSIGESNKN